MTTSNQRILVIGATGMLGKPVAQQLQTDGFTVRILARSVPKAQATLGEGYEYAPGDYEDTASLHAAMQSCDGVHINVKGGPTTVDYERADHQGVRRIAEAAKAAGVGRISLISSYALHPEIAATPETRAKVQGEAALKATGVPYTLFRCTWFMESLPLFVQGNRVTLVGTHRHRLHWLAAEDYARSVSRSYQTAVTLNKELSIYGPEAYTMREAIERYIQYAAPNLKISQISTRMLALIGTLSFNQEWKGTATLMTHYEKYGEDGSPEEANRLLGAPQTTLKEWCTKRQHHPPLPTPPNPHQKQKQLTAQG